MLVPGTRLGAYEIVSTLGVGGMGEVYRAIDTNLKRAVAVKVLPESVAADAERLARFQREAEVLARLNHPNIAAIYGLERSQSITALVMELVEGPTLADRIAQGPIPVDETLPIAKQIAEALEAAHEQGIIHRDLKPANVKVRPDGTVKVLDFGLAKALEPAGGTSANASMSPTITSPAMMTGVGTLLGTAAYMSPEQARGKTVDKRSDVWAFGCVLYEMLTGKRAFDGEDVSDTLAGVLRGEPAWQVLPASVPSPVAVMLRTCLERDPRKRPSDMSAVVFVLEHGTTLARPVDAPTPPASVRRGTGRRLAMVAAASALAAAAITVIGWRVFTPATTTPPVTRFLIDAPAGQWFPGANSIPRYAVSPDGRSVAFEAGPPTGPYMIWVRHLNRVEPEMLPLTEAALNNSIQGLFWFPDSRTIGYFDEPNGKLRKVDTATGVVQEIVGVPGNQLGGSANAEGTIIFSSAGTRGIMRVPASGGVPVRVTNLDDSRGEALQLWPRFLPDGRHFLFLSMPLERNQWAIFAGSLDSDEQKLIIRADSMPEFAPPDQLMYVRGDSLFAQTLDLSAMTVVGEPRLVAQPIFVTPVGRAGFVASNAGVLVTATGAGLVGAGTTASRSLTWFDRTGQEENVGAPIRSYVYPRISPDGTHVALDTRDAEEDIWIWSFARKTLSRLTFGAAYDRSPVWAFDSRRIIFASGDGAFQNLFTIGADATGPPERLTDGRSAQAPTAVTPDGRHVVFYETGGAYDSVGARSQLNILELGGTRPSQVLGPFPGLNRNGTVSPDGRWLAYESNESGRFEIYVRPYPSVQGGRWQVSTESGVRPLWSRDGRELFYVTDRNELMSVRVAPGTTWAGGLPERLFTNSNFTVSGLTGVTYDVAPDGRFLLVKLVNPDGAAEQPVQLLVVQNWFEELKLVPTN